MHVVADESNDRMWEHAQRIEDEPESYHGSSDVWALGRGHQRLDGRNFLDALEENLKSEKKRERLVSLSFLRPRFFFAGSTILEFIKLSNVRTTCVI